MTVWRLLAPISMALLSCAAATDRSPEPEAEASTDGSSSPPVPDASVADAADAPPADAAVTYPPLDVVCGDGPCYIALAGNGGRHFCGLLKGGTVRCWGRADDGALGRGGVVSALDGATPAPVIGLSNVTQITVGTNLGSCARTSDGSVYCWGRNDFGQLGRPASEAQLAAPTRIEGLPPVDDVRLGSKVGCAIGSSDRAVYCWGRALQGPIQVVPPQVIPFFHPPVNALTIGTVIEGDTIITLLKDNTLASSGSFPLRGDSALGKLERSGITWIAPFAYTTTNGLLRRWLPAEETLYLPSLAPIASVAISGVPDYPYALSPGQIPAQGGALTVTGRLFRWGPNVAGTLGERPETLTAAAYPLEMKHLEDPVVSFATAVATTCASFVNGKIKCWGSNTFGELGRGALDLDAHPEARVTQ